MRSLSASASGRSRYELRLIMDSSKDHNESLCWNMLELSLHRSEIGFKNHLESIQDRSQQTFCVCFFYLFGGHPSWWAPSMAEQTNNSQDAKASRESKSFPDRATAKWCVPKGSNGQMSPMYNYYQLICAGSLIPVQTLIWDDMGSSCLGHGGERCCQLEVPLLPRSPSTNRVKKRK